MATSTDQYRALRDRTDAASGRLTDLHCKHLACRPGCSQCCVDLTVSPIEYQAILEDLRNAGVTREALLPSPTSEPAAARADGQWAEGCVFLTPGGLCALYRFRPLICRTHGLPIAFTPDDENDPDAPSKAVSFCPLNFTDDSAADVEFGPTTTLDLDQLNADLADINDHFTKEHGTPYRRVPLRQLREDL